ASSNPVAGIAVTFAVSAGGGSLSGTGCTGVPLVCTTDNQGLASATLTLGAAGGVNTVTASATGLAGSPVTFTANGFPSSLILSVLPTATQQVYGNIPVTLQVRVTVPAGFAAPVTIRVPDGAQMQY